MEEFDVVQYDKMKFYKDLVQALNQALKECKSLFISNGYMMISRIEETSGFHLDDTKNEVLLSIEIPERNFSVDLPRRYSFSIDTENYRTNGYNLGICFERDFDRIIDFSFFFESESKKDFAYKLFHDFISKYVAKEQKGVV